MSRSKGQLGAGSLAAKLKEFFDTNPDEELSYADAAAKFGVPIRSVRSRVGELVRGGAPLETVHIIRRKGGAR